MICILKLNKLLDFECNGILDFRKFEVLNYQNTNFHDSKNYTFDKKQTKPRLTSSIEALSNNISNSQNVDRSHMGV